MGLIEKKGERFGGRSKGTPNKATTERVEKARIREHNLRVETDTKRGAITMEQAQASKRKLGKDIIDDLAHLFVGIATTHQPWPPNGPQNPDYKEATFEKYAKLALDAASELAKYQSPQFRAIMVAPAPDAPRDQRKRFTLTIFESAGRPQIEHDPQPPSGAAKH